LTTPTENPKPKPQGFFSVQTARPHESLDGSNSSLSCSRGELSLSAQAASGRLMLFLQFSEFGVKCFWGHNFGSRHARRSIKGSIYTDDHLVSKKIEQKNGSLDWRPGPVKVGQKFNNTSILWPPPKRTPNPNKKVFFNRN